MKYNDEKQRGILTLFRVFSRFSEWEKNVHQVSRQTNVANNKFSCSSQVSRLFNLTDNIEQLTPYQTGHGNIQSKRYRSAEAGRTALVLTGAWTGMWKPLVAALVFHFTSPRPEVRGGGEAPSKAFCMPQQSYFPFLKILVSTIQGQVITSS